MKHRVPQPIPLALSLLLIPLLGLKQGRGQALPKVMPHVTFTYERPGLTVPRFTLGVYQNGKGTYMGTQAGLVFHGVPAQPATETFDRRFAISAAMTSKIFMLAGELNRFNTACASKAKNIADTGKKTLSYAGAGGVGSCSYNYSENKNVRALGDIFLGIAETMDEGRRLDYLHRYDRLGLDAELETFAGQVAEGRAIEVVTIRESLESLATDHEVLQRVRTRATALLALVPTDTTLP